MSALCEVKVAVTVIDSGGVVIDRTLLPVRFTPGAGLTGSHQSLTLVPGNNVIQIPTGSIAMLLELPPTIPNPTVPPIPPLPNIPPELTLKGSAGDVGILITPHQPPIPPAVSPPGTNPAGCPLLLPLGTSPTIVIFVGGSLNFVCDVTFT
jgi:hypothetical protein